MDGEGEEMGRQRERESDGVGADMVWKTEGKKERKGKREEERGKQVRRE